MDASQYACLPLPEDKQLSLEEKLNRVKPCIEEVLTQDELVELFKHVPNPVCYDGFEPSGRMHIAQAIMKKIIVNNMTSAGFTFLFWIADWFALMNHKMDGDLDKIKIVGQYFIEVWKAVGMDLSRVKFLWASDEINNRSNEYWSLVLDIAAKTTLTRAKRCCQIMGRKDRNLYSSQIFYPIMQCADVFFLGVDVCQLGQDQRKVNVLAREYAAQVNRKPPIVMSHVMLPGLKKGQYKMSKSDPSSAIFVEDSREDIERKIRAAFCPPGILEENPCIAYMQYIVFPSFDQVVIGEETYLDFDSFAQTYLNNRIHPKDLKACLTGYLDKLVQPVRDHFANNEKARALLQQVIKYRN